MRLVYKFYKHSATRQATLSKEAALSLERRRAAHQAAQDAMDNLEREMNKSMEQGISIEIFH